MIPTGIRHELTRGTGAGSRARGMTGVRPCYARGRYPRREWTDGKSHSKRACTSCVPGLRNLMKVRTVRVPVGLAGCLGPADLGQLLREWLPAAAIWAAFWEHVAHHRGEFFPSAVLHRQEVGGRDVGGERHV